MFVAWGNFHAWRNTPYFIICVLSHFDVRQCCWADAAWEEPIFQILRHICNIIMAGLNGLPTIFLNRKPVIATVLVIIMVIVFRTGFSRFPFFCFSKVSLFFKVFRFSSFYEFPMFFNFTVLFIFFQIVRFPCFSWISGFPNFPVFPVLLIALI